ncbi:MAG: globin domain-containing protein [Methylococcaceae bacterium]|nr:globin domain-containing protein [Methylococcaceae bacterium]
MSLNVDLLEQSWERLKPQSEKFAESFYQNLFASYPQTRPLFTGADMKRQQKSLIGALVLVIQNLRKPEVLAANLTVLGSRHKKYGVLPEHFPAVGNVLLKTMEQYLGDSWNADVRDSWEKAYAMISALVMQGAGYHVDLPAHPEITHSHVETSPVSKQKQTKPKSAAPRQSNSHDDRIQKRSLGFRDFLRAVKRLPGRLADIFWQLPTFLVVAIGMIIFEVLIFNVSKESPISKILNSAGN